MVEILAVVELRDNSLRVSLSNQCWIVCTCLLGMSVGWTVDASVVVFVFARVCGRRLISGADLVVKCRS